MSFIHEDFLLTTKTAQRLYQAVRRGPADTGLSLPSAAEGCGGKSPVSESLRNLAGGGSLQVARHACQRRAGKPTAPATLRRYEKFLAWARTVPATLRNPLYHWTHLELKRYFGIDELLDERSAPRVWEQANAQLATDELSAHGILGKFHVKAVCTTDDPTDDLAWHRAIADSPLGDEGVPDIPSGQGAQRTCPRIVQSLGGPPGGGQQTRNFHTERFRGCPPQAARFLPRDGRPAERSRAESRIRHFPTEHEAATISAGRVAVMPRPAKSTVSSRPT